MIALIKFLIFGHSHKWKTIHTANFYQPHNAGNPEAMPIGMVYIQQCETCGKIIRRNLC